MIWYGWLFFGVIGFICTWMTLNTTEDDVLILFGLGGLFSWLLFAYMSLNVTQSPGGVTIQHSYPAVTLFGVAWAVITLYAVIEGPIALVDQRQTAGQEAGR